MCPDVALDPQPDSIRALCQFPLGQRAQFTAAAAHARLLILDVTDGKSVADAARQVKTLW